MKFAEREAAKKLLPPGVPQRVRSKTYAAEARASIAIWKARAGWWTKTQVRAEEFPVP